MADRQVLLPADRQMLLLADRQVLLLADTQVVYLADRQVLYLTGAIPGRQVLYLADRQVLTNIKLLALGAAAGCSLNSQARNFREKRIQNDRFHENQNCTFNIN